MVSKTEIMWKFLVTIQAYTIQAAVANYKMKFKLDNITKRE